MPEWLSYIPTPRDPLLFVPYIVFACFITWLGWKFMEKGRVEWGKAMAMQREANSLMALHGLSKKEAEAEVYQQIKDGQMVLRRRA